MRLIAIFITTLFFAVTSFSSATAQLLDTWDDFGAQYGLINTGIEILHIDSNLMGTALVENGVGYHFGGVGSIYDNPQNSLWFAMAAILGTIGDEDEIVLTGEDAEELLRRLHAADDNGDITMTTTTEAEADVGIADDSGTVRICLQTIFGCITIREIPE